jgi:hypothetical protein
VMPPPLRPPQMVMEAPGAPGAPGPPRGSEAMAATSVMSVLRPLPQAAAAPAVSGVPVGMQPPMAVPEAQALAGRAATSSALLKATSPHRALALTGFLPIVWAGP